jgi:hypothetical protein
MGRDFFIKHAESLDKASDVIPPLTKPIILLLALDARVWSDEAVRSEAKRLIERGCRYVWLWGLDAVRVEHSFREAAWRDTRASVIVDTSASSRSLLAAGRAWIDSPWVETEKDDQVWVAVAVVNAGWTEEIERAFAEPSL